MQEFIADAKNQAFRDEINLDLEDGYNDSTYASFEEIPDRLKRRIYLKIGRVLRNSYGFSTEEVSGFSEALESIVTGYEEN